jgi:hypothetical protein
MGTTRNVPGSGTIRQIRPACEEILELKLLFRNETAPERVFVHVLRLVLFARVQIGGAGEKSISSTTDQKALPPV